MKALIFQNRVIQVEPVEFEVAPEMFWVECPEDCEPGWEFVDGQFIVPIPPKPTPEELLQNFTSGIQGYIDGIAMQRGYNNGNSCVSYWVSDVSQWSADAKVFTPWRDQVWQLTFVAIEPFESGTGQLPDLNDFISTLPQIVWPL